MGGSPKSPRGPSSSRVGGTQPGRPFDRAATDATTAAPPVGPQDGEFDPTSRPQRDAPVGGQAVVEGVMMRGVHHWAVSVRRPFPEQLVDGALPAGVPAMGHIETAVAPFRSVLARNRFLRLPVVRGSVALVESLRIGFKALRLAADAQQGPDAPPVSRREWAIAVLGGVSLALVLFVLTPVGLTSLIKEQLGSGVAFWTVEAIVSTTIFVLYLSLISRLPDLRRVFEYHGAEHKTIACYEADVPLTPANAARFSRLHPRCGTSFMLIVMLVAVAVYSPLGLLDWYWMMACRLVGLPLIVGLSFEAIKAAGRHRERRAVRVLMWPGLQLQRLTTREPDEDQLEVAITALRAVLDREDPRSARAIDRVGIEVTA